MVWIGGNKTRSADDESGDAPQENSQPFRWIHFPPITVDAKKYKKPNQKVGEEVYEKFNCENLQGHRCVPAVTNEWKRKSC